MMEIALQGLNSSGGHCPTCFLPTYPGLASIDVAAYKQMDFSNQWVYFLGDITIRQMYGEFAALVHRAQVRQHFSVRLLLQKLQRSRNLQSGLE